MQRFGLAQRDRIDRRQFIAAASGIGITSIAGCSGTDNAESQPNDGQGESQADDSQEEQDTEEPDQGANHEDTSLQGEEEFEEFIESSASINGTDYVSNHWIEFENPSDEINLPLPEEIVQRDEFTYNVEEGKVVRGLGEFDNMYVAIEKDGEESEIGISRYFFAEDDWDDEMSAEENIKEQPYGRFGGPGMRTSKEALEELLTENVQGYDEVSDDLPEQYQEWIDG